MKSQITIPIHKLLSLAIHEYRVNELKSIAEAIEFTTAIHSQSVDEFSTFIITKANSICIQFALTLINTDTYSVDDIPVVIWTDIKNQLKSEFRVIWEQP